MMRRNSTRRRVHALPSGSIRSEEIAATDIALSLALSLVSRDWSRAEVSDMRIGAHRPGICPHGGSLGPPGRQNQLLLGQIKVAVTGPAQGARTRPGPKQASAGRVLSHGDQIRASDRNARRAAAANRPRLALARSCD